MKIKLLILLAFLAGCTKEAKVATEPDVDYSLQIEKAGAMHNDYQEYMLSVLAEQNLRDTLSLKELIKAKTISWFATKQIDASAVVLPAFNKQPEFIFSNKDYSMPAVTILCDLRNALKTLEGNYAGAMATFGKLKKDAEYLNGNERLTVGIPVQIAISSASYWHDNKDRWAQTFNGKYPQNNQVYSPVGCRLGLGSLGTSDVVGGISGAYGGIVMGPGGVLAGAVLGSSTASLGNIVGQVMGCLFNWW